MKSSWWSRVILSLTGMLTFAVSSNAIPPKYAAYAAIAMVGLQSFTHPVTQSTDDNKVANTAVSFNKE